ncbi:hypothetical protein [Micromonospora sp. NBC_01813]|uniref:hypothetical protein n=1 Tax=Micromonospora sp. NBC_01813 TaxID=2975988 RepID=UPI002DDA091D|nr:hypothetical protein [Micromonospora sp. NBC_01813]WSA12550.1 hypothetical protein OG958_08620 [Micromonospora sp. NBC_01813]
MLTAVAVAAGTTLVPASPATASGLAGYCPDGNGVTVIVDFQELGGPTIIRCAVGDQATGHTALKNAGISITGTTRWGESFICRIEGRPTAAEEACVDTPPASAYWSYWHAADGEPWTYSQRGVMARKPQLGSFEGWSFAKNRTASTSPPPRIAPVRPAPLPPATSHPATPQLTRTTPPAPKPPTDPAPPGGVPTRQPPATSPAPAGAPTSGPSSPDPTTAGTTDVSTAPSTSPAGEASAPVKTGDPAARTEAWTGDVNRTSAQHTGVPVMTVLGAGLLLAVAVAAVVTARRRRRNG